MFTLLDRDLSGQLDTTDFTEPVTALWLGRLEDRFSDLMDLITDQQVDYSLARLPARPRRVLVTEILDKQEKQTKEEL